MADARRRRPENAAGAFFVDDSCIDCDTCRWMAPSVFARRHGQSAVSRQPASPEEARAAAQALVSCPTASIGAAGPDAMAHVAAAAQEFPLPVTRDVWHCGYHDRSSFGATSYLLRTPAGNALIDVPRFAAPLVDRVEALGGVRWILLTHRDDVGPHGKWAERFGAERVLHRDDAPIPGGPVERWLEGTEPVEVTPGLTAIPTPGHTRGHVCYHWEPGAALFTGDHLAYDDEANRLEAWPDVCWHDWGAQTASMRRLAKHRFEWVLPGHGRRGHLPEGAMRAELERLVAWMETKG